MMSIVCYSEDNPSHIYDYCPSFAATILAAILFGIITIAHVIQAFHYRKPFTWVLIMACGWELGGYVVRTLSVMHQLNSGIYTAQFLLILLAPLWINAFVYMILGRMIHYFLEGDRIFGIRARRITLMFVLFDITAFVVQLTGGMMASGDGYSTQTIQNGLHIYTGGIGLQLAFIAGFTALALRFRQILKRQDQDQASRMVLEMSRTQYEPYAGNGASPNISLLDRSYRQAQPLLVAIWVALGLIVLRNVYRLIEYGMVGVNGNTITRHEWFQYVFDVVPMAFAMIALSVYHPGKVLQGARSDFAEEDKARKAEKKAKKQAKKDSKKKAKQHDQVGPGSGHRSSNELV